ncbi:HEAT repeat domain-containing protein [Pyxidicoccus xibeiensis]|uniref:HEAT repeat domain-containing protein n=1 Tax=Pyxidicoccus xibeiensis TaxID=2906759 RepID=UPI0020A82A85|nr:HEAT repeat domain-containing protein [Pyxidicoccus xibeiensis]MCP3137087.1 HEAT repeat domain-containing protein [Pyxidicoccus xibeiensis]
MPTRRPSAPRPESQSEARWLRELESPDATTRVEAAKALDRMKSRRARRRCLELVRSALHPGVREIAAWLLGCICAPGHEARAVSALCEVVSDEDETVIVRGVAAEALGMVLQDGSPRTREARRAGEALMALLRSPEPELRFWASYALGLLRWKPALEELERLAATDSERHRSFIGTVGEEAAKAAHVIRTGEWLL